MKWAVCCVALVLAVSFQAYTKIQTKYLYLQSSTIVYESKFGHGQSVTQGNGCLFYTGDDCIYKLDMSGNVLAVEPKASSYGTWVYEINGIVFKDGLLYVSGSMLNPTRYFVKVFDTDLKYIKEYELDRDGDIGRMIEAIVPYYGYWYAVAFDSPNVLIYDDSFQFYGLRTLSDNKVMNQGALWVNDKFYVSGIGALTVYNRYFERVEQYTYTSGMGEMQGFTLIGDTFYFADFLTEQTTINRLVKAVIQ